MKKLVVMALLSLGACASPYMQWVPVGNPQLSMAEAMTDCEFKTRQVAHTFGRYGTAAMEGFARRCMMSHGYQGHWVQ